MKYKPGDMNRGALPPSDLNRLKDLAATPTILYDRLDTWSRSY